MLREGKRHIVKGMERILELCGRKGSAMFQLRWGEIKAKGGNLGLTRSLGYLVAGDSHRRRRVVQGEELAVSG